MSSLNTSPIKSWFNLAFFLAHLDLSRASKPDSAPLETQARINCICPTQTIQSIFSIPDASIYREKERGHIDDVLIVGGGISGINAACRLTDALPRLSYSLLEGRQTFGGTWDLFKYPGIRSDSDLHTFGYAFDLTTMTLSIGDRHGLGSGLNHHGILEGDASVTRLDRYFGNIWDANPHLVDLYVNETKTYGNDGDVNMISLAHNRHRAWENSRANNPQFDFNPWRMLVGYGESGFQHEVLRGSFVRFDEPMIRSWFLDNRFPKGWSKRIVPFSTPEILAWAAVVEAAYPTVPGWSLGKGLFIPVPTMDGLKGGLSSLFDQKSTGATLGTFACDASNAVLGFFPSQISNLFAEVGLNNVGTALKCS